MTPLLRDRPHLITSLPTTGPPVTKHQAEDLCVLFHLGLRVVALQTNVSRNILGLITINIPKFEGEIRVFSGNLDNRGQRLGTTS